MLMSIVSYDLFLLRSFPRLQRFTTRVLLTEMDFGLQLDFPPIPIVVPSESTTAQHHFIRLALLRYLGNILKFADEYLTPTPGLTLAPTPAPTPATVLRAYSLLHMQMSIGSSDLFFLQ